MGTRRRRRVGWLVVGLGCALGVVASMLSSARSRSEERARADKRSEYLRLSAIPPQRRCWVFNHLNKAGGSTIKYMLKPWIGKNNVKLGLFDSAHWQSGKKYADEFLDQKNTLIWGAYTEGLRPHGAQDCKWFTIFRHPIPRLVSAYYYCKRSAEDGLCAKHIIRADEVDFLSFAEHWGNFGLRQFAVAFVKPEDAIAAEVDVRCERGKRGSKCPGWYILKQYLEAQHAANATRNIADAGSRKEAAETWEDVPMHDLLKPAKDLLSNRYAAVGILEDWETSLLLFNVALRLPNYDWPQAYRQIGARNNGDQFRTEQAKTLHRAWNDPELHKLIRLDLLLYDHALSVHAKQVAQYGLRSTILASATSP